MPDIRELFGSAREMVAEKTGYEVVPKARVEVLEAAWDELRATNRELDLLGWQVLDYLGGQPQEITTQSRRKMVQRARYVWMNDPQAGAAVGLMNDFVFGRGVPKPRAKDNAVQDALDGFWTDPDNKRALTTFTKQTQLGTDLSLQSNLFFQIFDQGDDGKVKMSVLDHDTVENCVKDPENPSRVLYWVVRPRQYAWDYDLDRADTQALSALQKPLYFEDWSGLQEAKDEEKAGDREKPVPIAPANRTGEGRIYHIGINRFSGQVFGVPEFQRIIRWFSAYNDFMKARVDIAQASAAFIMKRKVKGTPSQLARLASKAISRQGDIAGTLDERGGEFQAPPPTGSILNENDSVSHENFNLNSGAGNAQMDAHMIRAPISAATRWPQSYLGDESNSSLATATSLELPVLKAVESRQEVFEEMIREMIDLVIERAVDTGQISEDKTPAEIEDMLGPAIAADLAAAAVRIDAEDGKELVESFASVVGSKTEGYTLRLTYMVEEVVDGEKVVREAHEDKTVDEADTKRDLGYEFSMPSPLRRMMGDLVTAVQLAAQTFDPNNTNVELTRVLATIVFGEAFEVEDPADLVSKIWPKGYVDPMLAAAQAAQAPPDQNPFSPAATSNPFQGPNSDPNGAGNPQARLPEQLRAVGPYNAMESAHRDLAARALAEAVEAHDFAQANAIALWMQESIGTKNDLVQSRVRNRQEVVARLFDEDVSSVAFDALQRITLGA